MNMKMTSSTSMIWIPAVTLAVGLAAGCDRQTTVEPRGTAERAGERIDQSTAGMKREGEKVGNNMSDAAITAKVKTAIIAEPGLKALQIDVDTVNGVVTLKGTVDSPELMENARQVALTVEGVKSVNNQLTVKASS
jgi:osmotically-inducible protein OsmY